MTKSKDMYGPNLAYPFQASIQNLLGLTMSLPHSKYLGLSTFIRRNKWATFNMIKD